MTYENIIKFRSRSKETIDKVKDTYQKNRPGVELGKASIIGVRIKNHSPSPHKGPLNLKIKIPMKSRTPNAKSPACLTRRD